MKGQAELAAEWLGVELEEAFISGMEGGGGFLNAEAKKKIVVAVVKIRSLILTLKQNIVST